MCNAFWPSFVAGLSRECQIYVSFACHSSRSKKAWNIAKVRYAGFWNLCLRACFTKHGKVSLIPWNRGNVVRQAWRCIRGLRRWSGLGTNQDPRVYSYEDTRSTPPGLPALFLSRFASKELFRVELCPPSVTFKRVPLQPFFRRGSKKSFWLWLNVAKKIHEYFLTRELPFLYCQVSGVKFLPL